MGADVLAATIAVGANLARELFWVAAILILLSGLDDLLFDLVWAATLPAAARAAAPPPAAAPGRYAVLVPAWDEADVIGPMLRHALATIDHPGVLIFVGTYPNDPATGAAVQVIADPRVIAVTGTRPGPTSKADCLNQLWRAVVAHECADGRPFTAIVLHDAEDIIDPRSFALYDRHLPTAAMVQIPVRPVPDPRSRWIAGHYLDEFAQTHARDMVVRGTLGVAILSAGVGTAIRRDALERLAGDRHTPFNARSLTEDYELGHRIHALGMPQRFVREAPGGALIATRACFPGTLSAAVRQKARWLTGIALAGWDRLGWPGGLADRWILGRDRKGLLTAFAAILAYAVGMLALFVLLLGRLAGVPPERMPDVIPDDGLLIGMLMFNAGLLAWRLVLRAGFSWHAAGWQEAVRALPRAIIANGINFLAALRAIRSYGAVHAAGGQFGWDKTTHSFPAGGQLA